MHDACFTDKHIILPATSLFWNIGGKG